MAVAVMQAEVSSCAHEMNYPADQLLGKLLKDVSRSFYLTLRLLPRCIRSQIGLAYLLARTSDTIADTELIPLPDRLNALESLRNNILGHNGSHVDFKDICTKQASIAERTLLERASESIDLLNSMDAADRNRIRDVLSTILGGQELDLRRFFGANAQNIVSLNDESELDDYTYRVAGCVGEFWTRMLQAHILPGEFNGTDFVENGICFGKGLQLVNILRDLPDDLRHGRCYIPATQLSARKLTATDLLKPESENKFRPLYDQLLSLARAHLDAGWKYTRTIPAGKVRLRIACALPLAIGGETLDLLRSGKILGGERIKVPRSTVRNSIIGLLIFYPWGGPWRRGTRQ